MRSQALSHNGICGGQSCTGTGLFSGYLRVSLSLSILPIVFRSCNTDAIQSTQVTASLTRILQVTEDYSLKSLSASCYLCSSFSKRTRLRHISKRTAVRDVSCLKQRSYSCVLVDVTTLFQFRKWWAGNVTHMGEKWSAFRFFLGTPEGRRAFGRPRCRRHDNIRINLKERGLKSMKWNNLAEAVEKWQDLASSVKVLGIW
jgi:hypothetical protein